MTTKKITPADIGDQQLRHLYETAFPPEEQLPWGDLMRLTKEMPLDFTAYYDRDRFVGLTIVYPAPELNWFWYFAVSPDLRGQGYGTEILRHIIGQYASRRLILDMEAPDQPAANHEQRLRRTRFYERNGFHDTHAHRTYDGITYTIMMLGEGSFTQADYDDIISQMRRFWQPGDGKEEQR